MLISIEYCVVWSYYPKAASLAENIKQEIDTAEIKFIEGSGGAFEVTKDGQLIFSKREKGRFPESDEIISLIKS